MMPSASWRRVCTSAVMVEELDIGHLNGAVRKSMSSRALASISTTSSGNTRALTSTRVEVG
ncbi:hypothetical protein D3C84_1087940 [compost metagenome]